MSFTLLVYDDGTANVIGTHSVAEIITSDKEHNGTEPIFQLEIAEDSPTEALVQLVLIAGNDLMEDFERFLGQIALKACDAEKMRISKKLVS